MSSPYKPKTAVSGSRSMVRAGNNSFVSLISYSYKIVIEKSSN